MTTNSKKVALVIGSGSVKCAAAIGLQNVLRREGIEIGMLVGCSGGSLFAALMALGYDAPTIADLASRLWTRDLTRRHSYRDFFSILLPGPLKFSEDFGLVDDRRVTNGCASRLATRPLRTPRRRSTSPRPIFRTASRSC